MEDISSIVLSLAAALKLVGRDVVVVDAGRELVRYNLACLEYCCVI